VPFDYTASGDIGTNVGNWLMRYAAAATAATADAEITYVGLMPTGELVGKGRVAGRESRRCCDP